MAELDLSQTDLLSMFEKMMLIRIFEDKVHALFAQKLIPGTTHVCQGQEAVSVGVIANLSKEDVITCTYRGHGHCLAKGIEPKKVMAEIFGKSTGCCQGKGGSMHITDLSVGALGSFAIVGAGIPIATGAGLAFQYNNQKHVAVAFFGDGASNIGAFHEALNFASILKLPVVFVCENNLYGEYSPISKTTAVANIADRASAYNLEGMKVDGNNLLEVYKTSKRAIDKARAGSGPTLIECKTYRQKGHSRTDPGKYRPDSEVQEWLERDPLRLFGDYLRSKGIMNKSQEDAIVSLQTQVVEDAYQFALNSPYPSEKELETNVYN
jgi:TPP-dependent pyruvate/acetoin dehydrogenase alpha subunit